MKKKELLTLIDVLGSEKGISSDIVIEAIKDSFKVAYSKKLEDEYSIYKPKGNQKNVNKVKLSDALVRCEIDLKKGNIDLYHQFEVVNDDAIEDDFIQIGLTDAKERNPKLEVGDFYEEPINLDDFNKGDVNRFISNFKQKISKAEKDALLEAFNGRIGEIVTGTVEKSDSHCVIVNIGRTSAYLFPKDLIGRETYNPGDPIKVYICGIGKDDKKGSLIQISRSNPGFLEKLFESEIHEIYDQTVMIKDVARFAGVRSKVSVYSNDPNIDPSGACIGQNGNRIQAIVKQLGNDKDNKEKIDVITYKPNLGLYLEECLKPGIVIGAKIDEEKNTAIVVTQNDTSSLAIGQKGINVILARQLTKLKNIEVIDESTAIERGITYKSIDEFAIEAREEEKRKNREEALRLQKENEANNIVKEEKVDFDEQLFVKDEIEEDELIEEISPIAEVNKLEEEVTSTEVKEETVEKEEVEEEVTPAQESIPVKKVKTVEPIVTTEVKTTTTLESLERSLEEEKEKENKKSTFKSKKKKEENKTKDDSSVVKKESKKMSIYTEEELADFDDELDDEFDDEDYSEYDSDEYYDE